MAYLALVRHGESTWNAKGVWTGLKDVDLSDQGRKEAVYSGEKLKDIDFQVVYLSKLIRTRETFNIIKKILGLKDVPVIENDALDERDYGDLTGKNKWKVKEEYGEEQFAKWRRSWDFPVPGGETLKDVYHRVVPFYKEHILKDLKAGKSVLVVGHGNCFRALVKYLEDVPDEKIATLEFETGEIFLYQVNEKGDMVDKEKRLAKS